MLQIQNHFPFKNVEPVLGLDHCWPDSLFCVHTSNTRCCELLWHHISPRSAWPRVNDVIRSRVPPTPPSLAWPMCCGASNQTNVGRLGQLNRTSTHTLRGSVLWRPRQLRQTECSSHYTLRHTGICEEEPFHLLYPWNHIWKNGQFYWITLHCLPRSCSRCWFSLNYLCPGIKLLFVLKQWKGDHQQIFYKKCVYLCSVTQIWFVPERSGDLLRLRTCIVGCWKSNVTAMCVESGANLSILS